MRTPELGSIAARGFQPLALTAAMLETMAADQVIDELRHIGINFDHIDEMIGALASDSAVANDSFTQPLTTPNITTPIQFLQSWLPGFVRIITRARKIDELVGVVTAGDWADEEVIQGVMELTGTAVPYGDYTNVPLSSWNVNWERRSIVRFEEGLTIGRLEEARAAKIRVNSAEGKREAAALALEIERNKIGFLGYNNGDNRTYGFLNDPNLPAYVTVAANAGGDTEWSEKSFLDITADIRSAVSTLRNQSGDQIDPYSAQLTLAVATVSVDFLSVTNELGTQSVRAWITETYPGMRIVSAPELNGANGGDNVFYLYAESVTDGGSDDGRTFVQVVPAKFMTLGVEQRSKSYLEDFTNATAGVMVKRPYAIVRRSGI